MTPVRVLWVTTNLSPRGGTSTGAAGNAWRLVADELGNHVTGTILAPRIADAPARELTGGLEIRRVGPRRPQASLEDALRSSDAWRVGAVAASLLAATRGHLRRDTYDVVHAFWAFPAGWAVTRRRTSTPVVVSCPGSDLHSWSDRGAAGRVIRDVVARADVATACSADGIGLAQAAGARRTELLPVCFDPHVFTLERGVPEEPVVAYAGRLARTKGIFVLSRALRRLRGEVPGLRFVACGTGPDAEAFEREVREILGDRATFHGPLPPADVHRVMSGSRVVVLPSFGEGLPAVVLEALATGRPVVATDAGDHAPLLRTGGGRVVSRGDADALAAALNAELATTRNPDALRALVSGYTPPAVTAQLVELYDAVRRETRSAGNGTGTLTAGGSRPR